MDRTGRIRSADSARTASLATLLGALLACAQLIGLCACSDGGAQRGEVGIFDAGADGHSDSTGGRTGTNAGSGGNDSASTDHAALHVEIASSSERTLCKGECVELTASATAGTPPYAYRWSQGLPNTAGPHEVCPEASTIYNATVTDSDLGTNEFAGQHREASASIVVAVADACGDAGTPIDPPEHTGGVELCRNSFHAEGFGAVSNQSSARPLATDADGNVILAGALSGTLDLGAITTTNGGANADGLVAKFDAQCEVVWVQHFVADPEPLYPLSPVTSSIVLNSIAVGANSDIFLIGTLRGIVQIGSFTVGAALEWGVVLIRMTPSGDVAWAHSSTVLLDQIGQGFDVATDAQDNSVIAVNVPGGTDLGGGEITGNPDERVSAIAAYDSEGDHRWSRVFRGTSELDVEVDADGSVMVLGQGIGTDPIELEGGGLPAPAFEQQWFLIELDASGAFSGGSWLDPSGLSQPTISAGLAIVGEREPLTLFQTWVYDGSEPFDGGVNATIGVVRYSPAHEELWQRAIFTLDHRFSPFGTNAVDAQGDVAVAPHQSGSYLHRVAEPIATVTAGMFVEVRDPDGALLWSKMLADENHDMNGLAFDGAGALFAFTTVLPETTGSDHDLIKLAP